MNGEPGLTPEEIRVWGVGSEWVWLNNGYYDDESRNPSNVYVIVGFEGGNVQFRYMEDPDADIENYTFSSFGRYLYPSPPELRLFVRLKNILVKTNLHDLESDVQQLLVKLEI